MTYLQGDLDLDCKILSFAFWHGKSFFVLGPMYKRIHLETDTASRSDRVEWGHARYQTVFKPDQAYELVVEWLTSSGSIIADLVST